MKKNNVSPDRQDSPDANFSNSRSSRAGALLSTYPELANIADGSWRDAMRNAVHHRFKARTLLMGGGAPIDQFLLLLEGSIRVYYSDQDGREITLYCANPGDLCILSLNNLLLKRDLDVLAQARTDVSALGISAQDFRAALASSEAFRNYVLATLSERLCELMCLVQNTAFQNIEVRLACLLGRLFEDARAASIQVTHQELAQELGASREVISRTLKDFEQRACIELRRGRIVLLDQEVLQRIGKKRPA